MKTVRTEDSAPESAAKTGDSSYQIRTGASSPPDWCVMFAFSFSILRCRPAVFRGSVVMGHCPLAEKDW